VGTIRLARHNLWTTEFSATAVAIQNTFFVVCEDLPGKFDGYRRVDSRSTSLG